MIVNNVKIYDLKESILASGYPMLTKYKNLDEEELTQKDIDRVTKLSQLTVVTNNQAHEQCLTGIRVSFDLTFTVKAWTEAERYRFLEFVSSQSTMHRIAKFELDNQYCEYVDKRIIEIIKEKVNEYNAMEEGEEKKKKYLEILYSNPCGFKLTARMTTNYRCLKNIYKQRKDHRLPEWREFCKWIETLPYAKEFLLIDPVDDEAIDPYKLNVYQKKPMKVSAYKTDKDLDIQTLEGVMHASPGDFIVTGVQGEKWPVKPDIFQSTYKLIN